MGTRHRRLGKGLGRAAQMTKKKMNKLKHGKYALFSDFTEDCSQKGVFSGGPEELFKSYKGSQSTEGHGLKKKFRKHQKITMDDGHVTSQINGFK